MRADLLRLPLGCPTGDTLLEGVGTPSRSWATCGSTRQISKGKSWFGGEDVVVTGDATDSLKTKLKLHPKLYSAPIDLISPVYPHWTSERRALRRRTTPSVVAVDVGFGNTRVLDEVVTVDLMPYPNVDIVGQADCLPFATGTIDIVISMAVLQHVPDPQAAIAELVRILKSGGRAYVFVPFIQGFHAAPHDYQSYMRPGLERAMGGLRVERTESFGPTSGLVWVLGEWLSVPFSLGIAPLQRILELVFQTLLSPLKFLDALFRHMPGSENISTGYLVVGVKESRP